MKKYEIKLLNMLIGHYEFIKEAKKQDWFDNTLFVFVADHGGAIQPTYDIPLNYFHSPLIFYYQKL